VTSLLLLALSAAPLVPLPPQPDGVPWPDAAWPTGAFADGIDAKAVESMVDAAIKGPDPKLGETRAVVIIHHGALVLERYAGGFTADTRQVSWSVAKSITHALVGAAAQQGRLTPDGPMPNHHWSAADPRSAIPWRNWLQMNDGQDYHELDPRGIVMGDAAKKLFGPGRLDVAGYCAEIPLAHPVGQHWNYNSCGLVLVSDSLTDLVVSKPGSPQERRTAMRNWMIDVLFAPIGMSSATPEFDAQGLYYGSALIYATARDFARLGYLYLRGGVWNGRRILPEGWVDFARAGPETDDRDVYGAGFWITSAKQRATWPVDAFRAQGHEGQLVAVVPSKDLVVVRLGLFGDAGQNWDDLGTWMGKLVAAFPDTRVTEKQPAGQ
jgi:CubicO group peptidase (beta-lactamase class C family)